MRSTLFFLKVARIKNEMANAKATMERSDYAALLTRVYEHVKSEASELLPLNGKSEVPR